jgi:hypothetical protein
MNKEIIKAEFNIVRLNTLVRISLLPFDYSKAIHFNIDLLENDYFLSGVFLSSPDFFDEIFSPQNRFNKKNQKSLLNYYFRSTIKATPFGLFGTLSVLRPAKSEEKFEVIINSKIESAISLNFETLIHLFESTLKLEVFQNKLKYKFNKPIINKFEGKIKLFDLNEILNHLEGYNVVIKVNSTLSQLKVKIRQKHTKINFA